MDIEPQVGDYKGINLSKVGIPYRKKSTELHIVVCGYCGNNELLEYKNSICTKCTKLRKQLSIDKNRAILRLPNEKDIEYVKLMCDEIESFNDIESELESWMLKGVDDV